MLLTFYVSFIISTVQTEKYFNTVLTISSQEGLCWDSVRSVGNERWNYVLLHTMCLSVIQYEENNFWVSFLQLNVLVQKLNHMEMQSHNLAEWSTIFSLSLFHSTPFAAQFSDLNPLPCPDSYEVNKHCNLQNSRNSNRRKWRKSVFLCPSSLNVIVTNYILE